ncbi:MAG: hypothetical protein KF746_20090, partial [Chitinophagaceae bacterium]|nr:hypothetical protein [Chitinophagaceae bacterium]
YVAMGNNPIIKVDATGGCTECPDSRGWDRSKPWIDSNGSIWEATDNGWVGLLNEIKIQPGEFNNLNFSQIGAEIDAYRNYGLSDDEIIKRLDGYGLYNSTWRKVYNAMSPDATRIRLAKAEAWETEGKIAKGIAIGIGIVFTGGILAEAGVFTSVASMASRAAASYTSLSIDVYTITNIGLNEVRSKAIIALFAATNRFLPYSIKKQLIQSSKGFINLATPENTKKIIEPIVPGKTFHW